MLTLPRPAERYDPTEEARRNLEIEQADRQNWKHTGDVDHPHALTVRTGTGNIGWGVYTPTLTNVANLDASTAFECQYMRVGNTVTVSGKVDVDPTLTATTTRLGISLPITSNFGATEDLGGVAFSTTAVEGAGIFADATNDRAEMRWVSVGTSNAAMHFTFSYAVI